MWIKLNFDSKVQCPACENWSYDVAGDFCYVGHKRHSISKERCETCGAQIEFKMSDDDKHVEMRI